MSGLSGRGRTKSTDIHLQHGVCHDAVTNVDDVLKDSGKPFQKVKSFHK